jgi:hypothetical protein
VSSTGGQLMKSTGKLLMSITSNWLVSSTGGQLMKFTGKYLMSTLGIGLILD